MMGVFLMILCLISIHHIGDTLAVNVGDVGITIDDAEDPTRLLQSNGSSLPNGECCIKVL